jgi:hypothetical protein
MIRPAAVSLWSRLCPREHGQNNDKTLRGAILFAARPDLLPCASLSPGREDKKARLAAAPAGLRARAIFVVWSKT